MKYKGYEAVVAFDADDRILHGRLLCTQDVVSFEADNVNELEQAFRAAVDDYLAQCAASGRAPDRVFSGKLGANASDAAPQCLSGRDGRNQLERMDHRSR